MSVRVKLAETTDELDQLFRVRHRVFVEEDGYMPERPDRRIYDHFDAFPTTANVIAIGDGHVVGGIRYVEPSPAGTPLMASLISIHICRPSLAMSARRACWFSNAGTGANRG